MKNDFVQLASAVIALVSAGALETALPQPFGVGFPVLMTAVLFFSARRPAPVALWFALAAGGFEDSLSSLPAMTSVGFFACLAAVVRRANLSLPYAALAYPLYLVWLWAWSADPVASLGLRVLVALPVGVAAAAAAYPLLSCLERKAALDG